MSIFLTLAYLFFIGSVFGWVLELFYRNLTQKHSKWINPGFCTGPYLPIYGFGLCLLFLLASQERFSLIREGGPHRMRHRNGHVSIFAWYLLSEGGLSCFCRSSWLVASFLYPFLFQSICVCFCGLRC